MINTPFSTPHSPFFEPTLYDILEVSPRASAPVIKAAYRCLVQLNHPDKNPGDDTAAERLVSIIRAYAVLSNPQQRQRYDLRGELAKPAFERRGSNTAESPRWRSNVPGHNEARPFAFRPLI